VEAAMSKKRWKTFAIVAGAAAAAIQLVPYGREHSNASTIAAQQTPHHEFHVTARRYVFEPAHLEVHSGDLVKITLRSDDIAHSFAIDAYRIVKRVAAGGSVTFEFLSDKAGTFPFYCNLTIEDGCREMKGQLVVRP
jgi:cytochrome c oxidase subunit 2